MSYRCRPALAAATCVALVAMACSGTQKSRASYAREEAYAPQPRSQSGGEYIVEGINTTDSYEPSDDSVSSSPAPAPRPTTKISAKPSPAGSPAAPPPPPANQAAPGQTPAQPTTKVAAQTGRTPLLIYSATLTLAVFEAVKVIDAIETMAADRKGYLVQRLDRSITVRVPATTFQQTLDDIAALGDVLHRNVSVKDVSAEFRDLEMRLKNLQAVRKRLETLLDRANNVQAALAVERELSRVAGEIERIKGRLKLYSELIAFSTIRVDLRARPVEHVDAVVRLPFPWLSQLGLNSLLEL